MSEIGKRIIAVVRATAAADPDFVYQAIPCDDGPTGCFYVVDGCPSCLIGHGLWDAGLIGASVEGTDVNRTPFNTYHASEFPVMRNLDEAEASWLTRVQRHQDGGTPWGLAVAFADQDHRLK